LIDSWALGIIIYQLFTEKPHVFDIEKVSKKKEVFFKLYKDQKVDIKDEFFIKNQELKRMIEHLLKFDPRERLDL